MPKKPRSEQEVQKVREEILDKTLELINEVGYENFTMRKLANKLNMTATSWSKSRRSPVCSTTKAGKGSS